MAIKSCSFPATELTCGDGRDAVRVLDSGVARGAPWQVRREAFGTGLFVKLVEGKLSRSIRQRNNCHVTVTPLAGMHNRKGEPVDDPQALMPCTPELA